VNSKREKYLSKYNIGSWSVEAAIRDIKYALVVPAIAEYENIRRFIESFKKQDPAYFNDTLLLFVVNNSPVSSHQIKEDNSKSIEYLRTLVKEKNKLAVGLIDASSEGNELPEKDAGVGLARKIGMDAVLKMFSNEEKGLLICTDADCTFAHNYLTEIVHFFHNTDYQAAVIKFSHPLDDESTIDAVISYEIFLRYYVLGLKYSESPFAFHTVGSSMVSASGAYMDIEGMNKKKAAEDFYFLEKLAKKYKIGKINSTMIYPSSRISWRVPFGTGQRVGRFISKTHNEYVLYHPGCFEVLREWHRIFFNNDILSPENYLSSAGKINKYLYDFLISQGFQNDWRNIIMNIKNPSSVMKQKIRWFDGFRTLKLVHYLRDTGFGPANMFDAVDELFSLLGSDVRIARTKAIPERENQLEYLYKLREIDF
jgi:hypothetical protein